MATRSLKQPADRAPSHQGPGAGFSLEDVKALVQLLEESDVTHIAWQRGPEKVVIRRGGAAAGPAVIHAIPAAAAAVQLPASSPVAPAAPRAVPVPPAPAADLDKPGVV